MNIPNLDILIAWLDTLETSGHADRFDMTAYYRTAGGREPWALADVPWPERNRDPKGCGTVVCLAGACQLLGAVTPAEIAMPVCEFAASWLDLPMDEADHLFLGYWTAADDLEPNLCGVTLPEAIAHLRWLRTLVVPECRW